MCRVMEYVRRNEAMQGRKQLSRQRDLSTSKQLSYSRTLTKVYQACCMVPSEAHRLALTKTDVQHLNQVVDHHTSRVGLERMSIRSLACNKRVRRISVVQAVLAVQQQQQQQVNRNHSASGWCTNNERIRQASQMVSRALQLFACLLAHAHAGKKAPANIL